MADGSAAGRSATVIVTSPSGTRTRTSLDPLPFYIGRQSDNHLVLRDNRASRNHARIVIEAGTYYVEDLKSSHGVFVNGARVFRQKLYPSDRIEFGFPDSYSLIFTFEDQELHRILDRFSNTQSGGTAGAANLQKLRALVEVARALQNSLSTTTSSHPWLTPHLRSPGSNAGFFCSTGAASSKSVWVGTGIAGTLIKRVSIFRWRRCVKHCSIAANFCR